MDKNQQENTNLSLLNLDEPLTDEQVKEVNSKYKDYKARAWTFIIWEDSTNIDDFKAKISDQGRLGLKALYIRHDKDTRATGEQKKVHWHVIVIWENPTTYKNALQTAQSVSSATKYVEPIRSLTGAARYLTHMDDADKHQYDKSEVIEVGGVDYTELINSSRNDRNEVLAMCQYVRDNKIIYFDQFAYYCMDQNPEWHRILSERNTFFFKNLIQSQAYRLKEEYEDALKTAGPAVRKLGTKYVNMVTGEVLYDELDDPNSNRNDAQN